VTESGSPENNGSEKPRLPSRALRLLMWIAAIGILGWLFIRIDPEETIAAAARLRPALFIAGVIGFSLSTLILDWLTHYWVLRRFNSPIKTLDVLWARGETHLLLSLGFLYGQGGMAYAVSRRAKKPLSEVIGSLAFLMFNNLMAMMMFPTLAVLFFIHQADAPEFRASPEWRTVIWWLALSWPLCLGLIFLFAVNRDNPLRRRLRGGILTAFDRARARDYGLAISLRGIQVVNWCLFSWITLRAFEINTISLAELFILGPIIALAGVIPTPGRLGTSQGAWVLMFHNLAEPAALLAFSLMWTVGVNLARWAIGAVFLAINPRPRKQHEKT